MLKMSQLTRALRHQALLERAAWKAANEPAPTQNQAQRHYPEEWGPSTARRLTCVCGNPDPGHADKTPNVLVTGKPHDAA
jgi:hypothetical protein